MTSLFLAALSGCTKDLPDTDDTSTPVFEPKTITVSGETSSPNTQSLIPADFGDFYVVTKDFVTGSAFIQSVNQNGFSGSAETLPSGSVYNYGWGAQMEDGAVALPYQSLGNTFHGAVTLNADGSFRTDHEFGFLGQTGTGAIAAYDDLAVAVMNNADYSTGWPTYDNDSSLIVYNPYLAGLANYNIITLNDSVNAAGIAVHGDTAFVASVGDYVDPNSASFLKVDLTSGNITANLDSYSGLGLNGNLPYEDGNVILAGYNPDVPLALYDGNSVRALDLPEDCVSGSISAAQFVTVAGDDMQLLASATDYANGTSSVVSIVGNLSDNTWECETVDADRSSAYGVGIVGGADTFAAATDSEIIFLSAK